MHTYSKADEQLLVARHQLVPVWPEHHTTVGANATTWSTTSAEGAAAPVVQQLGQTFQSLLGTMQTQSSNQLQETVNTVMGALSQSSQASLQAVLQNGQNQMVALQNASAMQTRQLIAMVLTALGRNTAARQPNRNDPFDWGPGDKDKMQCKGSEQTCNVQNAHVI